MNTYYKFMPNVFLVKSAEQFQRNDLVEMTTRYGTKHNAIIYSLIIKKWFKKSFINQENIYLTDIELWGYNTVDFFWGTFNEDDISVFLYTYDLIRLRNNYEQFIKKPLQELGFEIIAIKK